MCALLAFLFLNKWKYCRSEFVTPTSGLYKENKSNQSHESIGEGVASPTWVAVDLEAEMTKLYDRSALSEDTTSNDLNQSGNIDKRKNSYGARFAVHQIIIIVINASFTTFLPSISAYATLPYGLDIYHFSSSFVLIANPIACIFAMFYLVHKQIIIVFITIVGEACLGYVVYLAYRSPEPPLKHGFVGGYIAVCTLSKCLF